MSERERERKEGKVKRRRPQPRASPPRLHPPDRGGRRGRTSEGSKTGHTETDRESEEPRLEREKDRAEERKAPYFF